MTTFDFHGKKAVATGAGGAIGGEIARGLAQAGAEVAIWDIAPEAARAKADEINRDFPNKAPRRVQRRQQRQRRGRARGNHRALWHR